VNVHILSISPRGRPWQESRLKGVSGFAPLARDDITEQKVQLSSDCFCSVLLHDEIVWLLYSVAIFSNCFAETLSDHLHGTNHLRGAQLVSARRAYPPHRHGLHDSTTSRWCRIVRHRVHSGGQGWWRCCWYRGILAHVTGLARFISQLNFRPASM